MRGKKKLCLRFVWWFQRKSEKQGDESSLDSVEVLVDEFKKGGLIVERVIGLQNEFIKLSAPLEILGKAAAELQFTKRTHIGMDLPFEWDEVEAFVRQPDGSLLTWCEHFRCYNHIIYGIVNTDKSVIELKYDHREVDWLPREPLLQKLESKGIVKEVLPLHDENKRKKLLRSWALNWWDFTTQPLDELYLYYGVKIAIYFAFLGKYTRWLLFPATLGLTMQLVDFGSIQLLVLPIFFICLISWAVLFFQFWKRKNSALLARWHINHSAGTESDYKIFQVEQSSLTSPAELMMKRGTDSMKEKAFFQRENGSDVIGSDFLKFCLTAVYLLAIQYFTRMGGKISVKLVKCENNENVEYRAHSLVSKVFGLYFIQRYIGIFYHALLHRNLMTLRQVLIQLTYFYAGTVPKVLENLMENSIPYLTYSFKKFRAIWNKQKRERGSSTGKARCFPRVEKEYLKPTYAARWRMKISPGLAAILIMEHILLFIKFGFSRIVPEEPAWVRAARVKNATQAAEMCSKQLLRSISGDDKILSPMKKHA
ncbi:anoctamin At1g73020 [Olea europaea subsp. europaea]|uniref:Anoctamin At1g73020 n=1 Tax=Olea europaea subsp. europaea TaxID=158383 RepID=A0A8S0RNN0_OLEEU|nr:anoctamin At1g73020 [Olea europaea subsp. europaea]